MINNYLNDHTCGHFKETKHFIFERLCPGCWDNAKTMECSICSKTFYLKRGWYVDSVGLDLEAPGRVCSKKCMDMWVLANL